MSATGQGSLAEMIVIADTSPLNYLIQIGCDILLPNLYGRIIVPSAVMHELRHPKAPAAVKTWLDRVPDWVEVRVLKVPPDGTMAFLDPGEREAIQLAQEQHADLLLIDERRGRTEAMRRGLATTGTLGVLMSAGKRGLIDAKTAYQRLITETKFRTTAALRASFLRDL